MLKYCITLLPFAILLTLPNYSNEDSLSSSAWAQPVALAPATVELTVYNLLGQKIWSHNAWWTGATFTLQWGGETSSGASAASGLYFFIAQTPDRIWRTRGVHMRGHIDRITLSAGELLFNNASSARPAINYRVPMRYHRTISASDMAVLASPIGRKSEEIEEVLGVVVYNLLEGKMTLPALRYRMGRQTGTRQSIYGVEALLREYLGLSAIRVAKPIVIADGNLRYLQYVDMVPRLQAYRLTGDLTQNGVVNLDDLWVLVDRWGTGDMAGDLNADGKVDFADITLFAEHFGQRREGVYGRLGDGPPVFSLRVYGSDDDAEMLIEHLDFGSIGGLPAPIRSVLQESGYTDVVGVDYRPVFYYSQKPIEEVEIAQLDTLTISVDVDKRDALLVYRLANRDLATLAADSVLYLAMGYRTTDEMGRTRAISQVVSWGWDPVSQGPTADLRAYPLLPGLPAPEYPEELFWGLVAEDTDSLQIKKVTYVSSGEVHDLQVRYSAEAPLAKGDFYDGDTLSVLSYEASGKFGVVRVRVPLGQGVINGGFYQWGNLVGVASSTYSALDTLPPGPKIIQLNIQNTLGANEKILTTRTDRAVGTFEVFYTRSQYATAQLQDMLDSAITDRVTAVSLATKQQQFRVGGLPVGDGYVTVAFYEYGDPAKIYSSLTRPVSVARSGNEMLVSQMRLFFKRVDSLRPKYASVYSLLADGTGLEELIPSVEGIDDIILSPSGDELAYTFAKGSGRSLAIVILREEERRVVAHFPSNGRMVHWMTEDVISYVRTAGGTSILSLLHTQMGVSEDIASFDGEIVDYQFSHNAQKIAVLTEGQLHVLDRDGGHIFSTASGADKLLAVAWSPESKWLAYLVRRGPAYRIEKIAIDGANELELASLRHAVRPRWIEGGRRIAFLDSSFGGLKLYAVATDGMDRKRIGPHTGSIEEFIVDSVRGTVAYSRWDTLAGFGPILNLYTMDGSGGRLRNFTFHIAADTPLFWSPQPVSSIVQAPYFSLDNAERVAATPRMLEVSLSLFGAISRLEFRWFNPTLQPIVQRADFNVGQVLLETSAIRSNYLLEVPAGYGILAVGIYGGDGNLTSFRSMHIPPAPVIFPEITVVEHASQGPSLNQIVSTVSVLGDADSAAVYYSTESFERTELAAATFAGSIDRNLAGVFTIHAKYPAGRLYLLAIAYANGEVHSERGAWLEVLKPLRFVLSISGTRNSVSPSVVDLEIALNRSGADSLIVYGADGPIESDRLADYIRFGDFLPNVPGRVSFADSLGISHIGGVLFVAGDIVDLSQVEIGKPLIVPRFGSLWALRTLGDPQRAEVHVEVKNAEKVRFFWNVVGSDYTNARELQVLSGSGGDFVLSVPAEAGIISVVAERVGQSPAVADLVLESPPEVPPEPTAILAGLELVAAPLKEQFTIRTTFAYTPDSVVVKYATVEPTAATIDAAIRAAVVGRDSKIGANSHSVIREFPRGQIYIIAELWDEGERQGYKYQFVNIPLDPAAILTGLELFRQQNASQLFVKTTYYYAPDSTVVKYTTTEPIAASLGAATAAQTVGTDAAIGADSHAVLRSFPSGQIYVIVELWDQGALQGFLWERVQIP